MGPVLLIEDEVELAELLAEALDDAGFSTITAVSDQAAYAVLEAEAARLALLITDINLGVGVTGFDLARRGRQLNPALKVIYITGREADVARFGVEGALVLTKPFEPRELAHQARELLAPRRTPETDCSN
jgi:DNA-binding response OmpR family regulator